MADQISIFNFFWLETLEFKKLPEYKLIKKTGPSHSPVFLVSLKVLKMKLVKASGRSIREAQKEAAKKILVLISGK